MSYHSASRRSSSRRVDTSMPDVHHVVPIQHAYRSTPQVNPYCVPTSIMMHSIPLPPLVSETVVLNPLLRYSSNPRIHYDINKRVDHATLSPHVMNGDIPLEYDWRMEPALSPSRISSLTIRITGIEKPVVLVLPPPSGRPDAWGAYITVWDVLKACYEAWSDAKHECASILRSARPIPISHHNGQSSRLWRADNHSLPYGSSNQSDAMGHMSYFQSSGIWAGLEPSQVERDVWLLHTRPARRGN